ncbi:MAG: hypothetical protein AAF708_02810 [Deinococcota bacterium]
MEVTPAAPQLTTNVIVLLTTLLAELPWPSMLIAFGVGFGLVFVWFSLIDAFKFVFESKVWLTVVALLVLLSLGTDTWTVDWELVALYISNTLTGLFNVLATALGVFSSYPLDIWVILSALLGGRQAYKQKKSAAGGGGGGGGDRRKGDRRQ